METFLGENKKKKGPNKVLIATTLVAVLVIVVAIGGISLIPSNEVEKEDKLEGAFLEGSKEFEKYTKEIIVYTDPNRLMQAMTGMGSITMYIGGTIRNKGDRDVDGLRVKIEVVDQKNKAIKQKSYVIIPKLQSILSSGENVDVSVNIGGFSVDDDRANVRWKVTAIRFAEY